MRPGWPDPFTWVENRSPFQGSDVSGHRSRIPDRHSEDSFVGVRVEGLIVSQRLVIGTTEGDEELPDV